jgi:hypothetical protein
VNDELEAQTSNKLEQHTRNIKHFNLSYAKVNVPNDYELPPLWYVDGLD